MTPDLTAIFVLIVFLVLFWSHNKALSIGFEMGSKADFNKVQSAEKPKKGKTVYKKYVDPLDKEMLDYE